MCDVQNNGKIQREFETRSTDDQPTIQWLPVVGSWTFLGVNMHFNEKLFMCDSCNFLVRPYLLCPDDIYWWLSGTFHWFSLSDVCGFLVDAVQLMFPLINKH